MAKTVPLGWRGGLAAVGALAVGLWLGIVMGLATRPRRDQPAGSPTYYAPTALTGPDS